MIIFACPHCKHKLQVQDQYAGKQARCLACKQTVSIPGNDATVAFPTPQQSSSLAEAATLGGEESKGSAMSPNGEGPRYLLGDEIARGGMGAVLRATDRDLRREVAVKYLLDEKNADQKTRFVEEAQITGQLEHPNIVPIHELGIDGEGRLFFSMKMVRGRSLGQVLEELRKKPQEADKQYSLGKLLTILVSVCNALAYAHSRNVIHRDLKPANIMLGDFGEVYVMDWGIAKVLVSGGRKSSESGSESGGLRPPFADAVTTGRQGGADLTQVGAIVGTPVYMPPEQASGHQDAISPRSDVYSLGATLYEILSLQPPVDRKGSSLEILMRVVDGEIVPPEQRCPERARRGLIPSELSAIAMKALATNPEDRYDSVEEVRHDLERYMEGRSVSAKHDTFREAAWKFIKRNKLASAFVTVLALVMVWSVWTNWRARRETDRAYQAYRDQVKKSAPAFVESARLSMERKKFDAALEQVSVAIESDPDNAAARLFKAHLHIADKEFAKGLHELEAYRKLQGEDKEAEELAALCRREDDSGTTLLALVEFFTRRRDYVLADRVVSGFGDNVVDARRKMLELYRGRIEREWPGVGSKLLLTPEGTFRLNASYSPQIKDLTLLKGMPLSYLSLRVNNVYDLSPLAGMPLTDLDLGGCKEVRDLKPLQGMPLRTLNLEGCVHLRDLTLLHGLPLEDLTLSGIDLPNLMDLRGFPLTRLVLSSNRRLQDLSPLRDLKLTSLHINDCAMIDDLSPLVGMPLTSLQVTACKQVKNLSVLRGMKLTTLLLTGTSVSDLSPLRGMPLSVLDLRDCPLLEDLSPLRGMPLTQLAFYATAIRDLSPLEGMNLESVNFRPQTGMKGIDVLRKMKTLKTILNVNVPHPAETFWKKYDAGEFNK